jgi:hypothetical protein
MRNILLHGVVHTARSPAGALDHVVVAGHAFGLARVAVSLGDLRATVAVDARTHEWEVQFEDVGACGLRAGERVRVVAADPDDPLGCYSSCETALGD